MFRKSALSAAALTLALAGGAQAISCNLTATNANHSCFVTGTMDADGFTVEISPYFYGAGYAYVIETSNLNYNDWNDPYIENASGGAKLADNEYVNGHARYICTSSCPAQIKVLPNYVSNLGVRVNVYRVNN